MMTSTCMVDVQIELNDLIDPWKFELYVEVVKKKKKKNPPGSSRATLFVSHGG